MIMHGESRDGIKYATTLALKWASSPLKCDHVIQFDETSNATSQDLKLTLHSLKCALEHRPTTS